MALANARALENPLVGRVDHLLEIVVGEQLGRNVSGEPADFGLAQADSLHHNPLEGAANPKYLYASAVAMRPRGVRSINPIWIRNGS